MRLLFVSHSFPPLRYPLENVGGMQRMATELHAAFLAHPEVAVRSFLLRTSWRYTHFRVVPFLARALVQLPRVVERERIDVVLFSSMVTAAIAPLLRRRLGELRPLLAATPVGRDVTLPVAVYQRWLPRVFAALDLVLPISRATAEECLSRGVPGRQVRVVPCGVAPSRFPPVADRAASRRALIDAVGAGPDPLPADSLLLCGVGRHVERKGFGWFVDEVMPCLPSSVHFWLAGEGPMTPAIRGAIARRGLERRVRLLGRISDPDLLRLYRGADLFVMPNLPVAGDIEGFGIVMLEAGMYGLPTVGARIEGIRDAIRDGENGVLVPSGDPAAFAAAIGRFHTDRDALATAARRAVRFTRETFAWPAIVEQYLTVFRTTLDANAGGVVRLTGENAGSSSGSR